MALSGLAGGFMVAAGSLWLVGEFVAAIVERSERCGPRYRSRPGRVRRRVGVPVECRIAQAMGVLRDFTQKPSARGKRERGGGRG